MNVLFKHFLQFTAICLPLIGISQNLPHDGVRNMNGATPSPNSSAITPQKVLNVDLYSGKASAGFELFNYASASGLHHSITLNYSGGGVRVDDIASNVGLGWSLNTGGILNRSFNGMPDEVPGAGFMGSIDTTWAALYSYNNDAEIDNYSFIAGNSSGQFVIGKNNQILPLNKSNIKIERNVVAIGNMGVTCPNINFKITAEDGVQYLYQSYNCSAVSYRNFYASSTWFLTQIISPFNTDTIFFTYGTKNLNYYAGTSHVKYAESTTSSSQEFHTDITTNSANERILSSIRYPDNTIVNFNYDAFKRLDFKADSALANITITNGTSTYGYVFNYSYFGPLLTGLSGTNNDITYQNYNAITDPLITEKNYRLKLKGFQKFSGAVSNTIKGHQFTYDNTMLITRGSASNVDNWGYQSSSAGSFATTNKTANLVGSQAASLKSIILPTGGSIKLDYELHTTTSAVHPNRITKLVSVPYSSQQITNLTHVDAFNDVSGIITMPAGIGVNTIYTKISITPVNMASIGSVCWTSGTGVPTIFYVSLSKLVNGTFTVISTLTFQHGDLGTKLFDVVASPTDQFKLSYYLDTETQCTFQAPGYYLNAVCNTYKDNVSANIGEVGGVRVKQMTQYDGVDSTKNIVKQYVYEYLNNVPSGVIANYPINNFPYFECYQNGGGNIIYNSWGHPVLSPTGQIVTSPLTYGSYNFMVTTDNSVNKIYAPGGSVVGYACVQEIDGTVANNNGKVVSEFSTFNDYSFLTTVKANLYPFNPQSIADFKYGLPIRTTVYDVNNVKVKKVENTFLTKSILYNTNDFRSRKIMLQTTACGATDEFGAHVGDIFQCTRYYPLVGRSYLTNTKETEYFTNGDSLVTSTDVAYDTTYHVPVNTQITNSKGELMTQKKYYAFNYTVAAEIAALKNANLKTTPIASELWKGTSSPILIDAGALTFQTTSAGIVKPLGNYSLLASTPISQVSWGTFNATQLLQQPSLLDLTQSITSFDNKGNALEVNQRGNVSSFIYGYKKSRVIAEASNASASEIGFTSFESDDKANWTLYPTVTATNIAHTGVVGMKVPANTGGIVRNFAPNVSSGSQNKQYIFSCWVKTEASFGSGNGRLNIYSTYNTPNSTTVYPANSFKSVSFGNTNGKWQYVEVMIDLEALHISSGDNNPFQVRAYTENLDPTKYFVMDDVRFYPANAQMNTYTYDPLFGKTSQCNPNNLITTYEYDVFGRLIMVRDMNGNILQKTDYNYK